MLRGSFAPISAGSTWTDYVVLIDNETGLPFNLNDVDTGLLHYAPTLRLQGRAGAFCDDYWGYRGPAPACTEITLTAGNGIDDPSPALGVIQWSLPPEQTRQLYGGEHRLTLDLEAPDGSVARVLDITLPVQRF